MHAGGGACIRAHTHTHTLPELQPYLPHSVSNTFWPGALHFLSCEDSRGNISIWLSANHKHTAVYTSCVRKHRIIREKKKNWPFPPGRKKCWPKSLVLFFFSFSPSPSSSFISSLNSRTLPRRSHGMSSFQVWFLVIPKHSFFGIYTGVWIFIRYGLCPNA